MEASAPALMNLQSLLRQTTLLFLAALVIGCRAGDPKTDAKPIPKAQELSSRPQDLSKMNDDELKKQLTPMQYNVCRLSATEPPFRNEYWDNHEAGLYVDVINGEALFASTTKFESGTGWPSFFQPVDKDALVEVKDSAHGMVRTEVRSKKSDSHLGHVFDDGPPPTGLRYCMNSASMRFVPLAKLKEFGYERFLPLFEQK
jgi:methionine-R-sulfoxide reductase